ncbi:MAG TPA: tRNA (guanosine(37)-N1)-methyltransferase TrmD [Marmoricola sp.]|nr:tRNA (guanosine(37)-N1)-methyltransferase TrmD [Marmoricola sp.]
MRVDVVSIFPDYLAPLGLSLPGKAQASGLLDLRVHDLRRWTHDRHRTVDDTPYGGGAGMVMRPEPWGEALDELVTEGTVLVVPTPAGSLFTQAVAAELATREHLVLACGRYEGIDQRVLEEAAGRCEVRELSLGDYVLNGGEVAALAMVEAVVRLLPGFLGNAASLEEESHADGLLEYPVYTRPAEWRGREVPEVLLSGDHARIATWRREQAERRTAQRRPDLAHPSRALTVGDLQVEVGLARPADLGEVQTLQWASVEPAQREPLDVLTREVLAATTLVVRSAGRLVATARGRALEDGTLWHLDLLMVAPDLRGRGLGRWLLARAEQAAPDSVRTFRLSTGAVEERTLRFCRRAGYSVRGEREDRPGMLVLTKRAR